MTAYVSRMNSDAKYMNDFRRRILRDRYSCFGWPYSTNGYPACLETEEAIDDFRREVENNAIVEIVDPTDRTLALQELDCQDYKGPVYCVGNTMFIEW